MGVKGKNYETFVLMNVVRVIRGSVHTPPPPNVLLRTLGLETDKNRGY